MADDSLSSAGELSDRELSEAPTSASGESEDLGLTEMAATLRRQQQLTKSQLQAQAQAQARQTSEYTKLALQEILQGAKGAAARSVRTLDELEAASTTSSEAAQQQRRQARAAAAQQQQQGENLLAVRRPEEGDVAAATKAEEQPNLAALAADRKVIQARLKELQRCAEWLKQIGVDVAMERTACRESTHTAVEAVKRKFDVLRSVINIKEKEFVYVVETAGKARLDAATRASCECTVALSELGGFVAQLEVQLDRLEGNRKLFDESRRAMLDATQQRTEKIDATIHRFQDQLDRIRAMSLGVHIKLDEQIEAVQRVVVPEVLHARSADPPQVDSIPHDQFVSSPTVKVQRQAEPIAPREASPAAIATAALPVPLLVPGRESDREVHRKSFHEELAQLRSAPMPRAATPTRQHGAAADEAATLPQLAATAAPAAQPTVAAAVRTGSPMRIRDSNGVLRPVGVAATREVPAAASHTARIAKIASMGDAGRPRSLYPPELEKLRAQVIASSAQAAATSSPTAAALAQQFPVSAAAMLAIARRGSPVDAKRTSSPMRTAVPMRTAARAEQRTNSPARRVDGPVAAQSTPGPGEYYRPTAFNARSVLSTPPRRR